MGSTSRAASAETTTSSVSRDSEADRLFVEEMAMLFELHSRMPRIAGRIYALMLISDEPHLSQQELADTLGVSPASVSTMTRRLLEDGVLEQVAVPGARRRYFRLRQASWTSMIRGAIQIAHRYVEQAERGLALPGPDIGPGKAQLKQFRDLFSRLADAFEQSLQDEHP